MNLSKIILATTIACAVGTRHIHVSEYFFPILDGEHTVRIYSARFKNTEELISEYARIIGVPPADDSSVSSMCHEIRAKERENQVKRNAEDILMRARLDKELKLRFAKHLPKSDKP